MMEKMIKSLSSLLLYCFFISIPSTAQPSSLHPQPLDSFNLSLIQQNLASCSYTVIISTSCSSPRYTRDQISLSFGDAYGNQINAPRIDDPTTKTFERCSSDTFQVYGPCAYQICYVYLYRTGPDGWKPDTVKISGHNSRPVTFVYNVFIPSDVWYGFNLCHSASSALSLLLPCWVLYLVVGFVALAITV